MGTVKARELQRLEGSLWSVGLRVRRQDILYYTILCYIMLYYTIFYYILCYIMLYYIIDV